MNPSELRIGNLVWWPGRDMYSDRPDKIGAEIYRVCVITDDMVKVDLGFGAVQRFERTPVWSPKLDELKGVPITERLLEIVGFKPLQADPSMYQIGVTRLGMNNAAVRYVNGWIQLCGNDSSVEVKVEAFHQVQNIFFEFTHRELEFKTDK